MEPWRTTIEPIAPGRSLVEMIYLEDPSDPNRVELRIQAAVDHKEDATLAAIQAKALLRARPIIVAEALRLGSLGGLNPERLR